MSLKEDIIERGSVRHMNASLRVLQEAVADLDMALRTPNILNAEGRMLIRTITEYICLLDRECQEMTI